jgi:hypothetical protein
MVYPAFFLPDYSCAANITANADIGGHGVSNLDQILNLKIPRLLLEFALILMIAANQK